MIKARTEERNKRIQVLRKECKEAGFDPDNLGVEVHKLTEQEQKLAEALEKQLETLESEIAIFNA